MKWAIYIWIFFLFLDVQASSLYSHCRPELSSLWQLGQDKINAGRVLMEQGEEMFVQSQKGWHAELEKGRQLTDEGRALQNQARQKMQKCRVLAQNRHKVREKIKREGLQELKEQAKSELISKVEMGLPKEYSKIKKTQNFLKAQNELINQRGNVDAQLKSVADSVVMIRNWPQPPINPGWELSGTLLESSLSSYRELVRSRIQQWQKGLKDFEAAVIKRRNNVAKWVRDRRQAERSWSSWKKPFPKAPSYQGRRQSYDDGSAALNTFLNALGTAAQIYGQTQGRNYRTPQKSSTCPPGWRRTGTACSCGRTTTMGPSYAWNFYRKNGSCRQ